MEFIDVEKVMLVVTRWLVMAEGALEVLKTYVHRLLSQLGLRGFPNHFRHVLCVRGD
jgi:hypothetical protein